MSSSRALRPLIVILMSIVLSHSAHASYEARVSREPNLPELPSAFDDLLQPRALQLLDEAGNVVCQFWLRQAIPVPEIREAQGDTLLPMVPQGTLFGVAEYFEEGEGCHNQIIPEDRYTVRYMHIPQDGNHVGAFPTRDFLFLLPIDEDPDPRRRPVQELIDTAKALDLHPYTLAITLPEEPVESPPQIRSDEEDRPFLFFPWTFRSEATGESQKRMLGILTGFGLPETYGAY